jgi:hypothetical protein
MTLVHEVTRVGDYWCIGFSRTLLTRVLCQENEGSVEIKQRPIKMGSRTVYKTLSPKRTPFQTGIDR